MTPGYCVCDCAFSAFKGSLLIGGLIGVLLGFFVLSWRAIREIKADRRIEDALLEMRTAKQQYADSFAAGVKVCTIILQKKIKK